MSPRGDKRRWTESEIKTLQWEWGSHDLEALAKKLNRSPGSVREKARLLGLGRLARGTYTLSEIARVTGYDRDRILTAARRAGANLRRGPRGRYEAPRQKRRHYAIDEDTYQRILDELVKHPDGGRLWRTHASEWGGKFRDGRPKPEGCVDCGTARRRHYAKGRCRPCHERMTGSTPTTSPMKIPRAVWSEREPPHCIECEGTSRPHRARGMCSRCYVSSRRGDEAVSEQLLGSVTGSDDIVTDPNSVEREVATEPDESEDPTRLGMVFPQTN